MARDVAAKAAVLRTPKSRRDRQVRQNLPSGEKNFEKKNLGEGFLVSGTMFRQVVHLLPLGLLLSADASFTELRESEQPVGTLCLERLNFFKFKILWPRPGAPGRL